MNTEEIRAAVIALPWNERVGMLEVLEESFSEELLHVEQVAYQAEIRLMETRLADYQAGRVAARSWNEIEAEIRTKL